MLICPRVFALLVIFVSCYIYSEPFFFGQQESGFVLENVLSLPLQSKYQGLGYVNNSLININSVNTVNPAVLYEIFYKELNLFYQPLIMGSKLVAANFTTAIKTDKYYLPLSVTLLNLTTGDTERMNIFRESLGYSFNESLTYTNISSSYYFDKYDINFGVNYKNIFQTIDDYYAYGANLDIGIVTPVKNDTFHWGLSWLNIIPSTFGTDRFPAIIRTSLNHSAGKIFFSEVRIYTEFDLVNIYQLNKTSFLWGIGTTYDFLFLPISVSFSLSYYGGTIGVDFEKENFNFSYAVNFNLLGPTHRFSLGYKFDFYPDEVKKTVQAEVEKLNLEKQRLISEYKKQKDELKKVQKDYQIQQEVYLNIIKAKQLIMDKNYSQAKVILEQTLKLDPKNAQVIEMLSIVNFYLDKEAIKTLLFEAKSLYEKGNYELAIEKLNKLLMLDPQHTQAIVLLKLATAQKCIYERKYSEAKTVLFEILQIEPDNKDALELLKKVDTLLELEE